MVIRARGKLIAALILVAVVIGVLIETAITRASTYYITVPELYARGTAALGQETAVSGNILGNTVRWQPGIRRLTFQITDDSGKSRLAVSYYGDKPDSFTNDWPVIAFGKLTSTGQFTADKLLIKCPSKYTAAGTNG
ncbi:hypothetical protein GCM10025857_37830 [Alicyclobacillus contaminans]|uniref:cytochrome c maturation protein CcmE n=1 Tax=Alicyclobacillus contaminans TaxID=392016 RepID=UPI00040D9DAC|nr:cytochrome c maturation protein CcmE [Alicyclobacillus contaminans]GMA52426.1 hypothetical protein GCM10025857_37830 [Alicyclobacillus contaminans]